MAVTRQRNTLNNTNIANINQRRVSTRQQQKQDALDFAEIIYDLFKEGQSNVRIGSKLKEEDRNE